MKKADILAFTCGAIAGVVAGLLLAPGAGKSTMDRLINMLKKQQPVDELANRELYSLSEISPKAMMELEKLKTR